ncbi:RNA polymerase sigma factor [Sandaracinus amylolyticus]|uniref:RNA polymerase sigma factor n=1 Tax=Sandaracinus amylolyticus TaxID=927083 RepID=UPI001F1D319E|nr:sigma-70 family RNA polymerase sigma factor [Sandaracinus amylolyticus]UJR82220.1 Hypothetical protein I5071_42850 [Sandaracinus amylolyticus]
MDAGREDGLEVALAAARARAVGAGGVDVGAVFDAHGKYVARVLRCLGVRDQELADVCQEVFLVVQRRLRELDGRASLRTWLYAICVRKALAARRDAARRRAREAPETSEPIGERTPQDELERTRRLAQAIEILGGIAEDKRAVFVLYEVEQLPMPEVAEIVGCPLQTAYSRLYAARKEIAEALRRLRAGGRAE